MKIEMGESLVYSWLRHVKDCQVVQTNWKVSSQWKLQHEDKLQTLMEAADKLFSAKYGYKIFKKNTSLSQILAQGECDAIGISLRDESPRIYAVEVAFHEAGLNYGSKSETIMKVTEKIVRTALCLYGYMDCTDAEIVFASPKINPAVFNGVIPCVDDVNGLFQAQGLGFSGKVVANSDFSDTILQPILNLSKNVADTSELFLRSYQMYKMFDLPEGGK